MRSDDPLDQLIDDLERVVPPDPDIPNSMQAAMTEFQLACDVVLGYDRPMHPTEEERAENDPEVRAAGERMRRAMNVMLGREPDNVRPTSRSPRDHGSTRRAPSDSIGTQCNDS